VVLVKNIELMILVKKTTITPVMVVSPVFGKEGELPGFHPC